MKARNKKSLFVAISVLILITISVARVVLGLPYQVSFTPPAINNWINIFMLLSIPILLFWIARLLVSVWMKTLLIALMILLIIPSIFISAYTYLASPSIKDMTDPNFKLIDEFKREKLHFRLYLTNCAIGCEDGLALREEIDLFWGVKLISPLWSNYYRDASEGHVTGDKSTVRITKGSDVLVVLQR